MTETAIDPLRLGKAILLTLDEMSKSDNMLVLSLYSGNAQLAESVLKGSIEDQGTGEEIYKFNSLEELERSATNLEKKIAVQEFLDNYESTDDLTDAEIDGIFKVIKGKKE